MITYSIDSLKGGMVVARPIYGEDNKLLLGKGVILNDYFIRKLKSLNVASLAIKDDATDDIEIHESIPEMVRGSTIKDLKELFGSFDDLSKDVKNQSFTAVKEAVTSEQFQSTFRDHPAFKKIVSDSSTIVDELIRGEATLGLNSIKTYDNYTFQHSIDVAIVSIMIGRKIGLEQKRLRELGIGGLLHDIGKTFVPIEIVNKPGKLTDEEFQRMKDHPIIGYELIKGATTIGVLPPHVAFQHHEKQDGSGYPRRLRGENNLSLSGVQQTIHLYGSISAVADIYDALSSDRPYRKAFPPEKVIEIMRGMVNSHLNRDVLREFLLITPVFPVGSSVKVTKGRYALYAGVVAALDPKNLTRPTIRLVFDARRQRIDPPIQINLATQTDTEIETIIF